MQWVLIYVVYCHLIVPFSNIDVGHRWFWQWLITWWHQAITWTRNDLLSFGHLGTNFIEILSKLPNFSSKRMHLKTLSSEWRPFDLGFNQLNLQEPVMYVYKTQICSANCCSPSVACWCNGKSKAISRYNALKQKCRHFDEIFITGCTESCQNDNFRCSQWLKFHQNDNISVSVWSLQRCNVFLDLEYQWFWILFTGENPLFKLRKNMWKLKKYHGISRLET